MSLEFRNGALTVDIHLRVVSTQIAFKARNWTRSPGNGFIERRGEVPGPDPRPFSVQRSVRRAGASGDLDKAGSQLGRGRGALWCLGRQVNRVSGKGKSVPPH